MSTRPAQKRADIVALPSLSHGLSNLSQAQRVDQVALHHPTLATRGYESEAKLRKALSVTSQNSANGQGYTPKTAPGANTQSSNCAQPLMMRPSKLRT